MRSLLFALVAVLPRAAADSATVYATPHDSYSSSVGVLGCKVNTNRIAYWPAAVDCNNICVSLSYQGRSVYLLRIDQSGGAHDVSYDAWNYLLTGKSATDAPTAGGAVAMQTENVAAAQCADLLANTKGAGTGLPLSAANSMNYLSSCLEQKAAGNASWVADNYVLYNIMDPICTVGYDETCSLDGWPAQNQPSCGAHALGTPATLTTDPVYNIRYPSGERVLATSGASSSSSSSSASPSTTSSASAGSGTQLSVSWPWALGAAALSLL